MELTRISHASNEVQTRGQCGIRTMDRVRSQIRPNENPVFISIFFWELGGSGGVEKEKGAVGGGGMRGGNRCRLYKRLNQCRSLMIFSQSTMMLVADFANRPKTNE